MTYKTETRTVYVTEDGEAHETPAHAQRHFLRAQLEKQLGSKENVEAVLAPLVFGIITRDLVRQFIATYDEPQAPKADADGWIEWTEEDRKKGISPLSHDTRVLLRLASGSVTRGYVAGNANWGTISKLMDLAPNAIVAYRVISD